MATVSKDPAKNLSTLALASNVRDVMAVAFANLGRQWLTFRVSDPDRVAHPPWRAVPQEVGREHERQVEERRYRVQDADAGEDVAPRCTEELEREAGVGPLPKHGKATGKEGENTEHLRDGEASPIAPCEFARQRPAAIAV